MARKKSKGKGPAYTMFNVSYQDGSVSSNRRVSNELLDQSFGESFDDLARVALENQDNEIAERSGQRRAEIPICALGDRRAWAPIEGEGQPRNTFTVASRPIRF